VYEHRTARPERLIIRMGDDNGAFLERPHEIQDL
jgi:hypothetical protein